MQGVQRAHQHFAPRFDIHHGAGGRAFVLELRTAVQTTLAYRHALHAVGLDRGYLPTSVAAMVRTSRGGGRGGGLAGNFLGRRGRTEDPFSGGALLTPQSVDLLLFLHSQTKKTNAAKTINCRGRLAHYYFSKQECVNCSRRRKEAERSRDFDARIRLLTSSATASGLSSHAPKHQDRSQPRFPATAKVLRGDQTVCNLAPWEIPAKPGDAGSALCF